MNQEITVLQLSPNKPLIVNLNTYLKFANSSTRAEPGCPFCEPTG